VTPPADNELTRARRGLAWRRWTSVLTTAATGVVLVALAARVGAAAAVATALFAVVALGAAAWRAAAEDRRWRRLVDVAGKGRLGKHSPGPGRRSA
jgi:hypothetical protein